MKDNEDFDLYENEDYTVSEICGEEHMSATTVSNIINQYNKSKEPPVISSRSKAFELFKSKIEIEYTGRPGRRGGKAKSFGGRDSELLCRISKT